MPDDTKAPAAIEPAALPVTQRAANALKAADTEKKLLELVGKSTAITTITNPAGLQECHAARMVLKRQRVEIQGIGKAARDDANAFAKAVIAEENRLIAIIEPEERRLEGLQDAWEAARAAERRAAEEKEAARVKAIDDAIEAIRARPLDAGGKSSAEIATMIADLEAYVIGESFAEQKDRAELAKQMTLSRLRAAQERAIAAEAESKRLADERVELERQRAEQQRQDAERRARAEADERTARERLEAERATELRRQDRRMFIDTIQRIVTRLVTAESLPTVDAIEKALKDAGAIEIVDADFGEFPELYDEARNVRADVLERLSGMRRQAIAREAEEARLRQDREDFEARQQQVRMLRSEIDGIRQQVVIAQAGRLGVRQGGTIQCIEDTLSETERWTIDQEHFGQLYDEAIAAKVQAIESIRALRGVAIDRERIESEQRAAQEKAEADARAKADEERRQQEAKEAAERAERQRLALIEDGRSHLQAFVDRFGQVEQFAGMARAINAFLTVGQYDFVDAFPMPRDDEMRRAGRQGLLDQKESADLTDQQFLAIQHQRWTEELFGYLDVIEVTSAALSAPDTAPRPKRAEELKRDKRLAEQQVEGLLADYENHFGTDAAQAFDRHVRAQHAKTNESAAAQETVKAGRSVPMDPVPAPAADQKPTGLAAVAKPAPRRRKAA